MASLVVPLFLTPPARAIGRARRGATGMAGRAVLAWSSYRQGRASSARGPPLTSSGVLAFLGETRARQGGNGGWRSGGKGVRGLLTGYNNAHGCAVRCGLRAAANPDMRQTPPFTAFVPLNLIID